jgi:hypothetical protein
MDGSTLLCLVLVAYIAWRERAHAVERHWLLSRRGGVPPAPFASSRRRGRGGGPPRVISAEDDKAFNEWRDSQAPPEQVPADDEIEPEEEIE